MKKTILLTFLSVLMWTACAPSHKSKLLQTTDKPLSVRMAQSEMLRNPDATTLDGCTGRLKWNYTNGLEALSFIDLFRQTGDSSYWKYALHYADTLISTEGKITSYSLENYNIDQVCPGRILFPIYEATGDRKYKVAMDTLFKQMLSQPRTSDSGFWHKKCYPYQMWLDGLYMGEPFYAEYASTYVKPKNRQQYYDDIVHQFVTVGKHTFDPQTKVYRHGWDESREMFWADSLSGQSAHCWGRGLGWYVMGMVDALDYLPESADRQAVIDILHQIYYVLPEYADKETGMWYQVLEYPRREGNYLESTGSIMFVYGLLKGIKTGIFSEKYTFLAKEWYVRFVNRFVKENPDGSISITDCCAGAGLGGSTLRSGTFDYYINETKIIENDCKAVGPFIWASMLYEELVAAER